MESTGEQVATTGPIDVVFSHLIEQPLNNMRDELCDYPPIFVLDAIDECDSTHRTFFTHQYRHDVAQAASIL